MAKPRSIVNRRALRDYLLIDKYTAGLVLFGHEVKSLRTGDADLRGSYIIAGDELWLVGAYIAPYRMGGKLTDYDPYRNRKLLVSKQELTKLESAKQNKLAIVPLSFLTSSRYVKLHFATARGRKKYDKRDKIERERQLREAKKAHARTHK